MRVQVSVVVPTYNRPDLLDKCLNALLQQDFESTAYEIVVVDNAGSEATRRLVESLSGPHSAAESGSGAALRPAVFYLEEVARRGPAAARNAGWMYAHGDVIAFTDDDCLPDRSWLTEGMRRVSEGYDAVTGLVIVPIKGVPTDYAKNMTRLETAEFVTANCFVRCSALQLTGGFDERFTAAWREDSDLHFKLVESSLQLGRAMQAQVVHPVRSAPWGISLREQRKSMFNALLFKKYPALYRQRIQRRPPIRYYAILLAELGMLLSVLAGWNYGALLMVLIWMGLTTAFLLERLRGTQHDFRHVTEMLVTSLCIPVLSIYWRISGAIKYRVWFL